MAAARSGSPRCAPGEIKATAINEPTTSQAREQGVNILIDLAAEKIPWLFSGVVVRRSDLKDRRDLSLRFLRAVIEGNYLALTDDARAKAVLARELKVKNPRRSSTSATRISGAVAARHGHLHARGRERAQDRRRAAAAAILPTTSTAAC